jgi:hypothetical protein
MSGSTQPTLAGFQWFIANIMGIAAVDLPPSAPVVGWTLAIAMDTVNPALNCIGNSTPGLPATNLYTVAVYNLGGSLLINLAQDTGGSTYFQQQRALYNISAWLPGVVASTADSSTSTSLLNPEFMKNFTLANLQQLKDPFGRMYLQIAQSYGPSIWGLS